MSKRLTRTQALYRETLDAAATELGLEPGTYRSTGKKHDSYTVILGDGTPVKVSVYCTPTNAEGYATILRAVLRANIARNLERGGNT